MALNWAAIQSLYDPDPVRHFDRCVARGLDWPLDPFEQLLHEPHAEEALARSLQLIDWSRVHFEERALSGVALRQVAVLREAEHALEETRSRVLEQSLTDERDEVLRHWSEEGTWLRPPVLIDGGLLETHVGLVCLIGITRLGNLLGLLDRGQILEAATHRVWIGVAR